MQAKDIGVRPSLFFHKESFPHENVPVISPANPLKTNPFSLHEMLTFESTLSPVMFLISIPGPTAGPGQ